jgi:hypothetical protein
MFQHFQIDEDSPLNLKHRQRASKQLDGGGRQSFRRRTATATAQAAAAVDGDGEKDDDSYRGAAGWRRSAELPRPRRTAAAAAAADGDGEKGGSSTSKSGDTKPKTQPSMDRGLAMIFTEVPLDGGGRRSFRRRRTATAAAGWMETVK